MEIVKNILPVIKLFDALKYLKTFNAGIKDAQKRGDFEKEREYILLAANTWATQLIKTFKIELSVTGAENIPECGPVVFVSNHQGYADIPILFSAIDKFQFGFIAKANLEKIPFYGRWIKQIRSVYIKRNDARASLRAIDEGIRFLEDGFSLLIFPEGTRGKGGPMAAFKKGSLRLATKPGVPIIPITINGSYRVFEAQGYIKNGAHVDVTIHKLIETKHLDKASWNNLSTDVENIIRNGLESNQ